MDIKELGQRLGELVLLHTEKVAIGVLAILIVGAWLTVSGEGRVQATPATPSPGSLPRPAAEDESVGRNAARLVAPASAQGQSPAVRRALIQNPFSERQPLSAAQIDALAQVDLQLAEEAIESEDFDSARRLVSGILRLAPDNARAIELNERIEEAVAVEDEPAAQPGFDDGFGGAFPGAGPDDWGMPGGLPIER